MVNSRFSIDVEKYLNITFAAYRNYPDESVRYYGVICQCWLSNQNGALRRPDSVSSSRFGERRALLLARYVMRAYAVDVCSRYINGCGRGKSWGYRRCWYSMKRHGQSGYYVSSLSIHAFRARRAGASLVRVYTRSKVHIQGIMRAGTAPNVTPRLLASRHMHSQTLTSVSSVCSFCVLLRQNRDPSSALRQASLSWLFRRTPVFQTNDGSIVIFSGFSTVFRRASKIWESSWREVMLNLRALEILFLTDDGGKSWKKFAVL